MFWDNAAFVYDIFADVINRKTNKKLCSVVEKLILPTDNVLECACGTGLLSGVIAKKCESLTATDFSEKMLARARRKFAYLGNVKFEKADILRLSYPNETFDVIVAANVIHLLDDPHKALSELFRVCKPGGRLIIPTYMNKTAKGASNGVSDVIDRAGANFRQRFTPGSYEKFFADAGYINAEYTLCDGVIPCVVAVLKKEELNENHDA